MKWLQNNIANIVLLAILAVVVFLIVRKMIRDKKAGKTSCSCGCSGCAMKDSCHSKQRE